MVLRRDPALWAMLFATALRLACAFWLNFSIDQQALLNTLVAAVLATVVAFTVRHDGQVSAILGFFAALVAAAVGFGLKMSPENQALIMSFVGAVVSMFSRTQMGAAVPPVTNPVVTSAG